MRMTLARLITACLFVSGALAALPASAQQFTMKISSPTINDIIHEWMKQVKAGVEQRSGGRIKVDLYPANQLGQLPTVVDGVAMGTIELANTAAGFVVGLEPRFQVFDAPGVFDSMAHVDRVMHDPEVQKRLATFGADKNIEILGVCVYSPLVLASHKAMRTVADAQGQKVRMPGGAPIQIEPFKKIGMLPVSMPLGEALPALNNRSIDGVVAGMSVFTAFKYYDVVKPVTELPSMFLLAPMIASRTFLKSLGPELEKIVREEAAKANKLYGTFGIDEFGRSKETWGKNGGEYIVLPPAESKRYVDTVASVLPPILGANPRIKEDYEALMAAAKKHRQ
jgi:TRAP-type C4-dicarboxylate transport system substrate-binding protein